MALKARELYGDDEWHFETLEVEVKGRPGRINLIEDAGDKGADVNAPPPPPAPTEPEVKLAPSLALRRAEEPPKEPLSVRERLKAPVGMLLASLVVAGIDTIYHKVTGNPLELGPVRPFWIAAPLALVGVGFLLWRLMGAHDDE